MPQNGAAPDATPNGPHPALGRDSDRRQGDSVPSAEFESMSDEHIDHGPTLKKAALDNGVSEELYDRVVDPLALTKGSWARPR
jgi:hypothetical protein